MLLVVVECDKVELIDGHVVLVKHVTQVHDLSLVGPLGLLERLMGGEIELSRLSKFNLGLDVVVHDDTDKRGTGDEVGLTGHTVPFRLVSLYALFYTRKKRNRVGSSCLMLLIV